MRNQLSRLVDQLHKKHDETRVHFQVDLQRLQEEFQRKYTTQRYPRTHVDTTPRTLRPA